MPANECNPYFEPGTRLTVKAEAALTGKRFVAVSDPLASDGSVVVSAAPAQSKVLGVAAYDVAEGKRGIALCGPMIVPVTASAGIEPGEDVQVATGGKAVKCSDGAAVGEALNKPAAEGQDVMVRLYAGHA